MAPASPKKTVLKKSAPKKTGGTRKMATKKMPLVRFLKLGKLAAQPQRKKARLDVSSDLDNLLTTPAGVLDISAASGSRPAPKEVVFDVAMIIAVTAGID